MLFRGEKVRTYFISWEVIRSHLQRKEDRPAEVESEGPMSATRMPPMEQEEEAVVVTDHQEVELRNL